MLDDGRVDLVLEHGVEALLAELGMVFFLLLMSEEVEREKEKKKKKEKDFQAVRIRFPFFFFLPGCLIFFLT